MEWAQILIPVAITIIGWAVEAHSRKSDIAALNEQIGLKKEQVSMQRSIFNKPPFSEVMWFPKMRYRITVDGFRSVYIESLKCIDDNCFFLPDTQLPQTFKPSEPIDYLADGSPNVEITWRWADMPEMPMETIRRRGIKPSM